uniref:superoxide dismutase n=1 Tax=Lactuca sativa TaxID=4236 RepID=A0A9R1W817_LACSA|nr:hypothetical protein LSAT_V11C300146070 [Lactuca sativa]
MKAEGAVWLAVDKELKRLVVETTSNQYKNVRPDYLKNIWKVINMKYASEVEEQIIYLEPHDTTMVIDFCMHLLQLYSSHIIGKDLDAFTAAIVVSIAFSFIPALLVVAIMKMSSSDNNGLPCSSINRFPLSEDDLPHVDQGERMFPSSSNGGTRNHASPILPPPPPSVTLLKSCFLQSEKYEVTQALLACKHQDSNSVCAHVLKMKSNID